MRKFSIILIFIFVIAAGGVPVCASDIADEHGVVKISPNVEHNLGVKTFTVKRSDFVQHIKTIGHVVVNEDLMERVYAFSDGWIKKLYVKYVGDDIQKGQRLFDLYSPTLVNAQEEYLLALHSKNSSLISAGVDKLRTLGVSSAQITKLKKTRKITKTVSYYAHQNGFAGRLNVREGEYIKPAKEVIEIENLSSIWMLVDIFERQAQWVKVGQQAIATLTYLPARQFVGRIEYIYPKINPKSRTLAVRLVFPNPKLTLKPNMYANVEIETKPLKNVIVIPGAAVIRVGTGNRVVMSLGGGKYQAHPVQLGVEDGAKVVVLDGLKEGDSVVTSAQFLIDSESSLQASFERMTDSAMEKSPS